MSDPLQKAPLAYENEAFLSSPDGRFLRILAEYLEPLTRFRHQQIQDCGRIAHIADTCEC